MAASTSSYLLPGSPPIGSKSVLIKQTPPPPPTFHPIPHQFQHPFHRPPMSSHIHQQYLKSIPNGDTFHSLTVTNTNNGSSLLTTNNNNNNLSSVLTTNNNDDNNIGGGLSQSMESINNIGLTDDEVIRLIFFRKR